MKKLILMTLPLLLVACGTSKVAPVETSSETQIQTIIVPAEENEESTQTTDKPQKEVLAKPAPTSSKNTETEPTTDEMTNEIDAMIDNLISDL